MQSEMHVKIKKFRDTYFHYYKRVSYNSVSFLEGVHFPLIFYLMISSKRYHIRIGHYYMFTGIFSVKTRNKHFALIIIIPCLAKNKKEIKFLSIIFCWSTIQKSLRTERVFKMYTEPPHEGKTE